LALTGVDKRLNTQYSIEPTANYFRGNRNVNVIRDYDSIICFTAFIPVTSALYIYPLPNPAFVLKSSLHLKIPMRVRDGEDPVYVHPHLVPNICLGDVGVRARVMMFFPRLYDADLQSAAPLTPLQLQAIYEDGFYPAVSDIAPDQLTNWPVNYAGARIRARNHNGSLQYGTRPFPQERAERFGYEVRARLAAKYPWAQSIVFMTQVKGIKEAHQHTPGDELRAAVSLENALQELDPRVSRQGYCYVDVGLELSQAGCAYQWRTDGHARLVEAFTELNAREAANVTRRSARGYERDYSAGLIHVSGCRVNLGASRERGSTATYMQAYTTDKAPIQHLEGGRHGLTLKGSQALHGSPPEYMENIHRVYMDASHRHDSAARLEFRVPLSHAQEYALDFPPELMLTTLCVYPRVDWWQWRALRLLALSRCVTLQNLSPPQLRYRTTALMLTAAIVYLTNALHSRPDDDQAGRELMCAALPLTNDYNLGVMMIEPNATRVEDDLLPTCPFGAFFLRDIEWPPAADCPRFHWGRHMRDTTFIRYLGHNPLELWRHHNQVAFIPTQAVSKKRVPTRKGMTKLHSSRLAEVEIHPHARSLVFPLAGRPRDVGNDQPDNDRLGEFSDDDDDDRDLATTVTHMWLQFASDMLQKCGNLKGQPYLASHCRLTPAARLAVTEDVFRTSNLATVFYRVRWKTATRAEWGSAFERLFPPPGREPPVQPQNYPTMQYYHQWSELKGRVPHHYAQTIHSRLRLMFDQLTWMARPYCDRVWMYQPGDGFRTLPPAWEHQAPQVLLHPRVFHPEWE
ncbi:hypothetical protein HYDPIDRAFT_71783, partial [Hydnomerulius pinastri MD-312]